MFRNRSRDEWVSWVTVTVAFVAFAILLSWLVELPSRDFWKTLGIGFIALAGCLLLIPPLLRPKRTRAANPVTGLIHRITGGDLSFRTAEIDEAARSAEMSAAIRGLLINLERTITRFTQLTSDVSRASDQLSKRSSGLAKASREQHTSARATTTSMQHIDESIHAVQRSVEKLSLNAEETSTSILQMSASIEEVARVSDTLSSFVEQTASGIEEMIASINEVATNTESFSSFAIETASSMVQMNATTEEIGRAAKRSFDLARSVTDAATEGRQAVFGTVDGMRKIENAVDEAKEALNMLNERSEEIGEIIRVIDEITGQTNLLALNAAIIAAQAGDRGKGFAVVADEIRDLSERTSVSTEEIRTLIENVQRGVQRATAQMTLSAERVTEGVDLTARAEHVLEKIIDLTERSRESISEIAKATEEQSRGSQAATQAIEEVTKMVQQTATATQEQSRTSRTIGEQAAMVRDYTKHLRRAMEEQESGSQSIARAMENILGAVATVAQSTGILTTESASIVRSMQNIEEGTQESNFGVAELNQLSNTLKHESALLQQELQRFKLPLPQPGGTLRTAIVLPTALTLDPAHCHSLVLGFMSKAINETLVQFAEGAELVPGLAEHWEVLNHGRLYRFHLRENVRFHNGRLLTAEDVRDSFLRMISPEVNSHGKWIMRNVKGAVGVIEGRSKTAEGFRVVDRKTIEILLDTPLAFFLLLLSMPETAIVPVEEMENEERARLAPTGAGAFEVANAVDGDRVELKRHRAYYIANKPNLDSLTFRLDYKSAREVIDGFLRGELDVAHGIPMSLVSQLKNNPRHAPYLIDTVQLHTSYLGYDCSSPPFDRVEVRQAVNHAINRSRINERVFSGLNVPAKSLLPPGLVGYDPLMNGYEYNPERARDLLRTAGYPSGFSIDYWSFPTDEFFNSGMIALIVEDLETVGIHVNVSQHDVTEARGRRLKRGHNSIFSANWYADFPDSDNFFFIFFHSESNATPGLYFNSPALDTAIEEGRTTTDHERRAVIYRELNSKILHEAPMVFLFHDRFFAAYRPEARGMRTFLVPPPIRYQDIWCER